MEEMGALFFELKELFTRLEGTVDCDIASPRPSGVWTPQPWANGRRLRCKIRSAAGRSLSGSPLAFGLWVLLQAPLFPGFLGPPFSFGDRPLMFFIY